MRLSLCPSRSMAVTTMKVGRLWASVRMRTVRPATSTLEKRPSNGTLGAGASVAVLPHADAGDRRLVGQEHVEEVVARRPDRHGSVGLPLRQLERVSGPRLELGQVEGIGGEE